MGHLGVVLYEYLGEEYPEVLGSILGALKSIVNVIGMTKMTPPIKDLLPRLTPILKNRSVFLLWKEEGWASGPLNSSVTDIAVDPGGMFSGSSVLALSQHYFYYHSNISQSLISL